MSYSQFLGEQGIVYCSNYNLVKLCSRGKTWLGSQVPKKVRAGSCEGVTMHAEDCQGNKREEQVKLQGNEHIIGLISHQFTFPMRGMLGTPTLGAKF